MLSVKNIFIYLVFILPLGRGHGQDLFEQYKVNEEELMVKSFDEKIIAAQLLLQQEELYQKIHVANSAAQHDFYGEVLLM